MNSNQLWKLVNEETMERATRATSEISCAAARNALRAGCSGEEIKMAASAAWHACYQEEWQKAWEALKNEPWHPLYGET